MLEMDDLEIERCSSLKVEIEKASTSKMISEGEERPLTLEHRESSISIVKDDELSTPQEECSTFPCVEVPTSEIIQSSIVKIKMILYTLSVGKNDTIKVSIQN